QRKARKLALGTLVAGIKKDIVVTNQLDGHQDRVGIYGWHQEDGAPIQPISILHGKEYADYSHGLRLVHGKMRVEGEEVDLASVMRDPWLCALVSDEGPMKLVAYPI